MRKSPLTVTKIAKHCAVTHRCVLNWIEKGKLGSYTTPGGHHRVTMENFLSFLKEHNMPIPGETRSAGSKKRILIVDDDENVVRSIRRILRMEKIYEIDSASNGFDAGRKILSFNPDIVLLDIRMPGIDGYEVARKIKKMPEGKNIKIIVISAYFNEDGKQKIISIGADACMEKPFDNEELLKKIEELLRLKQEGVI